MTDPAPDAAPQPETEPPALPEERPDVEVMPPAQPAQPPAVVEKSALEHAAEELMATPGAPGRDEFLVLATTARILSMSAGAPAAVRNNPWLAFHLALVGRDLGISPSAAIAQVDVIGYNDRAASFDEAYKNAQLSLSPELLNAQIKRLGLGSIVKAASRPESCVAVALLPGGRIDTRCARTWPEHVEDERRPCTCTFDLMLGEVEFTWKDAQQARLADSACTGPDAHTAACLQGGSGSNGKRCHQGYRTYPQRMMWWRAAGWCQSDYFPEAGVGLYSPEELGAIVDPATGRPVDPGSVALPEGYEEPERPRNPADDLLSEADADPEAVDAGLLSERNDLRARVDAITAAGEAPKAALAELWEKTDDDGNRRWPPFRLLRRRHLVGVRAMVKSIEDRIKKGEWGDEAKTAWADASVTGAGFGAGRPQEAQEGEKDADAQEEAPAAGGAEAPQEPAAAAIDAEAAYQAEVEASADARRQRAQQLAAEAGLEPAVAHAQDVADRVKAMELTDVAGQLLNRFGEEPQGNPQAQRKRLAELIYLAEVDEDAALHEEPPEA